jgi:hypothetical protein
MSRANRNHHKSSKDNSRDAVAPAPSPARPPGDPSSAGPAASRASAQAPAQRPTAAPPVRSAPPAEAPARSGADAPALAAPARAAPPASAAPAAAPFAERTAEVNGSGKEEKRAPAAKAPAIAAKPAAKPKEGAEADQPTAADRPTAPAPADRPAPQPPAVRLAAFDIMAGERRAAALPGEGELKGAAAVDFDAGSAPRLTGELQAGGPLVVRYASNRSPWGVQAFVEFKPGGERHTAPAIAFREEAGRLASAPQSVPLLISVPKSATSVALFFKQWTGADRSQEVWDSNWGQNYVFEVKRP